ncbi:hypothetical protein RDI58_027256 [Solanum bulbocastanum]|uniref:RWP-RK domain-containing protein n=1 Tax=Solanum bulbocastanum TaxID=147425 RepID=A0AAN8SV62_SOLBU
MEHLLQQPSEVCSLMPRELDWCQLKFNGRVFWSTKHNDELEYQRSIKSIFSYSVVPIFPTEKWRIQSVMQKLETPDICLLQFWAPIKVNGSTFLSTADQPFAFYYEIDKRLSSYRKLCLDTLIPIGNKEIPFGPPGRVFSRRLPEYNPDVPSYSSAEFPLLQTAILLGIHSYYAFPVSSLHSQLCVGVFEIVSTQPSPHLTRLIMGLDFKSVGLYITNSLDMFFGPSNQLEDERVDDIEGRLYEILERHRIPLAQIWIPFSPSASLQLLRCAAASYREFSVIIHYDFIYISQFSFIESGEALVGRAFASQGSCFCEDVTQLSIKEYPLLPSARKAGFTQSFAICLQIASGNELGQRMLVEVVEVNPSDEFDSFEIGQRLPSVQSLQDGRETTETDSLCQQSNLQNGETNVAAALLVPSCSSDKRVSLNCERTVEVDPSLPHPIEEAVTNRGTGNMDVAHDDYIEDTTEIIQLDSHFEQPNLETNSAGNTTTNNKMIHSHKKNAIQRIEKDHGITRKILEQHYGMTLEDAAKDLHVSRATLKRICREHEFARWPNHKTRKVNVPVSQDVSFQGTDPYVGDQQCPALSQEKGTVYLDNKESPATGKPCDSVMTLKVTYRGDIIKFQLPLSSTRLELEGEVEKRLKISLQRFSIKYQDEDDDWILITTDSDLRDGMHSIRSLGRTTMRLLVTPGADT